jgi:hypothetical protein
MKKLKTFESFSNQNLVKEYGKVTQPSKPYKRELTEEENEIMDKNFPEYSWSSYIDSNGHIVLGNGMDHGGYYYITEDDLNSLV